MRNASLLLIALAERDQRMCFAYNITGRTFVYANPAFRSFFQIVMSSGSIQELLPCVNEEDRHYLKEAYEQMVPGILRHDIEFRMNMPDAKEYALRLSMFFEDNENNERVICGYVEDISAYNAHAEKMSQLNNKKNSILNILSHDLSGPLGSIRNFSTLLR
jgi:two-component system sensor histidine kinase VicK